MPDHNTLRWRWDVFCDPLYFTIDCPLPYRQVTGIITLTFQISCLAGCIGFVATYNIVRVDLSHEKKKCFKGGASGSVRVFATSHWRELVGARQTLLCLVRTIVPPGTCWSMVNNCFNRSSLRRLSRRRSSTPDSNLADLLPDEVIERICLLTLRPDLSFSSSSSASSYAFGNFSPLWLTRNDFVTARPLLLLNKRFQAAVYSIVTRFSFFMINGWLDLNAPGLVDSLRKCTNLRELQLVVHDDPNKFSVHNLNVFLSSTRSNIKAVHLT